MATTIKPRPGDACDPRFLDMVRLHYMSPEQLSLAACWRRACKAAEGTDIPIASYATVRRLMYRTIYRDVPAKRRSA
ncbi:hypothetical protein [Rhodovulum steppense]|uniref:Transposase n=1 Tax=Rhodovulum steppense TaxID=540251 RepID=A0A4V2R4P0_9RHOB|nr:hypothetical protein [Rhodovulum steppense]TCM84804.1 hypothetical protein EV216_110122 [Rhodovulum steppense]